MDHWMPDEKRRARNVEHGGPDDDEEAAAAQAREQLYGNLARATRALHHNNFGKAAAAVDEALAAATKGASSALASLVGAADGALGQGQEALNESKVG